MFRIISSKGKNKLRNVFNAADLVVLDEGHRIKNDKSNITKCLSSIKTRKRIVLTGTPLQNNMKEYYCMVEFVRPGILGTPKEFRNRFEAPILNGQCRDSDERDVKVMKQRIYILHQKLKGFVHRRDYSDMDHKMPEKFEFVIFVRLSDIQVRLYKQFINGQNHHFGGLFNAYSTLTKIWNHPDALLKLRNEHSKNETLKKFIVSDDDSVEEIDNPKSSQRKNLHLKNLTNSADHNKWYGDLLDSSSGYIENSVEYTGKLVLTLRIVSLAKKCNDKVIIFSQSLFVLDIIGKFLLKELKMNEKQINRIDGRTSSYVRQKMISAFQKSTNSSHSPFVFLISTKAGGLGVDLSAANRVIVFDAS